MIITETIANEFKSWFIKKYSWLFAENQFEVLKTTDVLVLMYKLSKDESKQYVLYEKKEGGSFSEIKESSVLSEIEAEYIRRQDKTVSMDISEKISLIEDDELRAFASDGLIILKARLQNYDKFASIQASVWLSKLKNLTFVEFENCMQQEFKMLKSKTKSLADAPKIEIIKTKIYEIFNNSKTERLKELDIYYKELLAMLKHPIYVKDGACIQIKEREEGTLTKIWASDFTYEGYVSVKINGRVQDILFEYISTGHKFYILCLIINNLLNLE